MKICFIALTSSRLRSRHFANDAGGDDRVQFVAERNQLRPANGNQRPDPLEVTNVRRLPIVRREWVRVASVNEVPDDGGIAVRYGDTQIALFHFPSRGEWHATQNMCPHKREMVLARGILGDQGDVPKVACPLHKKTFDLRTGA